MRRFNELCLEPVTNVIRAPVVNCDKLRYVRIAHSPLNPMIDRHQSIASYTISAYTMSVIVLY